MAYFWNYHDKEQYNKVSKTGREYVYYKEERDAGKLSLHKLLVVFDIDYFILDYLNYRFHKLLICYQV